MQTRLQHILTAAVMAIVLCPSIPMAADAASLTLVWDPYTPPADFKEFRFYRANQACTVLGPLPPLMIAGAPAKLGKNASGVLPGSFVDPTVPLIDGPVCYEMDAIDTSGNVSTTRSNRAEKVLNLLPPLAPAGLTVTTVTP